MKNKYITKTKYNKHLLKISQEKKEKVKLNRHYNMTKREKKTRQDHIQTKQLMTKTNLWIKKQYVALTQRQHTQNCAKQPSIKTRCYNIKKRSCIPVSLGYKVIGKVLKTSV